MATSKFCTKFEAFKWRYNWAEKFLSEMKSKGYGCAETEYKIARRQQWSEGQRQGLDDRKLKKYTIDKAKTECVEIRAKVATICDAAWRLGWWSSYRSGGCAAELHGSYTVGQRDAKCSTHTNFVAKNRKTQ